VKDDSFSIASFNMAKLDEYYMLNKSQAKLSFLVSVIAVSIGFATLILSIKTRTEGNAKLTTALSGVFLQFIGGSFFYVYNKSLVQLNIFYEKLVQLQNTMLAVQLSSQLDATDQSRVREQIILKLLQRSENVEGTLRPTSNKRKESSHASPMGTNSKKPHMGSRPFANGGDKVRDEIERI
jgi:hypothetical protein